MLQVLYGSPDLFLSAIVPSTLPQKLLDAITLQLFPTSPARAVLHAHVAFLAGPFVNSYPDLTSAVQQTALFPFLLASKTKLKTTRGVWGAIKEGGGFQAGWLRGCVDIWDHASLLEKEVLDDDKDEGGAGSEKLCEANLSVADKIAGEWCGAGRARILKCRMFPREYSRREQLHARHH